MTVESGPTGPKAPRGGSLRMDRYVIFGATEPSEMESEQHGEQGLAGA